MKSTVGFLSVLLATFAVHDVRSIGILPFDSSLPPSVFDTICPENCPAVVSPVFDENGFMYGNKCKMQAAKCKQKSGRGDAPKPTVTAATPSALDSFCPDACLAVMKPVYDENGVMYDNECKMRAAKCKKNKNQANAASSESSSKTTQSTTKKCADACPDITNPVCGSDGIKYSNPCQLKIAACKNPELNIVEDDGPACISSKETTIGFADVYM